MSDAYCYRGLPFEIDLSNRNARIDGFPITSEEAQRVFALQAEEEAKSRIKELIDSWTKFHEQREKAQKDQLEVMKQSVSKWNKWRKQNPEMRPLLFGCNLTQEALGHSLDDADFSHANLIEADLQGQSLKRASFHEANLAGAELYDADLTKANFCRTDLYETKMQCAKLIEANLQGTQLAKTDFRYAKLIRCTLYGLSAWDLKLEGAEQSDLIIRYREGQEGGLHELRVDDLLVAQFLYTLLNNSNLQTVINQTTSKVVLILGRFSADQKKVLDKIREALRQERDGRHRYVPIIFDFEPSEKRGLTETILLLACLARFVIADLTGAKSLPQELSHIVPNLPSVPVQPILHESEREYAMFEHWRRFPWVLPEFIYKDVDDLEKNLEDKVITPPASEKVSLAAALKRIDELEKQLASYKSAR